MRLTDTLQVRFDPRVIRRGADGSATEEDLEVQSESSDEERDFCIAAQVQNAKDAERAAVRAVIETTEPMENPKVEALKKTLFEEFGKTALSEICPVDPPVRGPYGEAEIWLKPDARPVSVPPYRFAGERWEAHAKLVEKIRQEGKIEPGLGAWNTPSFPVPKKKPGEYRLVQDLRKLNEATVKDGHPLPLIEAILQRQGKYRIWTVLDLSDGYHQMPLKKEHRPFTCMSTPKGTMQWKVQVMGLKNAGAQFQRMMEWVLTGIDCADSYIDDIIIGSSGDTEEELLANHARDVRRVLQRLQEHTLVCSPKKSHFFMRQVEFCGHILREGARSPAPGTLMPIQHWELPNYFSEYVEHYADFAGPLTEKLKVGRIEEPKVQKNRWTGIRPASKPSASSSKSWPRISSCSA